MVPESDYKSFAYSMWTKSHDGLRDVDADACGAGPIGKILSVSIVGSSGVDVTCCSFLLRQLEGK